MRFVIHEERQYTPTGTHLIEWGLLLMLLIWIVVVWFICYMIVERRLHKMELQCYFCGIAMTDDEMKVPHLDGQAHPECQEEYINAQLYEEK